MRFIIKVDQTDEQEVLSNTHTHTHTHIYIYIYIYIYYLVCGFGSFLLKKAERNSRYHIKRESPNTRIVNEQMVA